MRPTRPVTLLLVTVVGGLVALGCGLADVFASPGLEPVVLTFQGDTMPSTGTTVPFRVLVLVDRDTLAQPRLVATSSDTAVIVVTPGQDSLRAVGGIGRQATLTVRLLSSILTDTAPTLQQNIRIKP